MKRINFLDGYRGLAILLVMTFHAFVRWPLVVPYGEKYSAFPVFKFGFLGVQLFFLISGFVILMSLKKNRTFLQFIYKRWLRLFPAMVIATVLVYLTSQFLKERPGGMPEIISIVPGLIFIDPAWICAITGIDIKPLEGVFWSLFVEVKFYFIFGLLYFMIGELKAIAVLAALFLFSFIPCIFNLKYARLLIDVMSFEYFGWFAAGALAYLFFIRRKSKYLIYCLGLGALEIKYDQGFEFIILETIIILIFCLPVYFDRLRFLLNNRFLLFFGFISYPLYLIHESAMIALIVKMHAWFPAIPDLLLPLIPVAFLALVSYVISKTAEPLLRKLIQNEVVHQPVQFIKKQVESLQGA